MSRQLPEYDKSKWRFCGWENEPDRVDFIHAGFSCFILRNHSGNWCGYVGLPSTHPLYGKPYHDIDVDVHGGLTFSDKCGDYICHVPEPGMPDDVWWLGFDTGHYNDMSPAIEHLVHVGGVYRTMGYTINETKDLAKQLKELGE